MAYTITLSNGTTLPVVLDGVTDTTSTSITLIGKNYVGYGAFLNQNFAKLLENFSNTTAPANPLTGQIWWDSLQKSLKVYTGTSWKSLASSTVGASAPAAPATGDQWFDTSAGQLKAWDGSAWLTIGPAFTSGQGISGAIAETITDNLGSSHVIVRFYISGVTVGILSKDATFTPSTAILGFSTIKPGLNLSTAGNFIFYSDAYNALNLGGVAAANYARTDTATTFNSTVSIANNSGLTVGSSASGDFTANVTSSAVNLKSNTVGKALNLIAAGQTNPALSIASGTGLVTVAADPVSSMGIATKQYVDSAVGSSLSSSTLILRRDGTNTITGVLTPDVTSTRDFGTSSLRFAKIFATNANIAGQVELSGITSGIKFSDGTVQTTAATSPAAGSITPDRLSAGGPYWTGAGNVGIGTSSPNEKLDVLGTIRLSNTLNAANYSRVYDGGGLVLMSGNNNPMAFYTSNNERMRITPDGDVGINRTIPTTGYKLDVNGPIIISSQVNTTPNANWTGQLTINGSGYTGGLAMDATGLWLGHNSNIRAIIFATDKNERVRITSAGNVGIGTASPQTGTRLDVAGVIKAAYPAGSSQAFVDQDITLAPFYTECTQAGSSYVPAIKIRSNGTARTRLSSFGSLHYTNGVTETVIHGYDSNDINDWYWRFGLDGTFASPGSVYTYSDETLKENIAVIDNGLEKVLALRGVTFNRKGSDIMQSGVIAQEVEKVLPEVVTTGPDGIKSVAYGNLTGLLIEAIKDLKAEVDSLKQQVAKLSGK